MSRSLPLPRPRHRLPTPPSPPRHHRACPGDPDVEKRRALHIGMAGTSPAMTGEGVTKEGTGRTQVQGEGGCGMKKGCDPGQGHTHRVATAPARSSPALVPSDVIIRLVPVISIGKARPLSAPSCPAQARSCREKVLVGFRGAARSDGGGCHDVKFSPNRTPLPCLAMRRKHPCMRHSCC